MFDSLRKRLVWSQILPLLLALPLMGALLVYTLEGQILIPQLAKNLVNDSRLLAEISSAEFELWGDPILFESLISRVQLAPDIQVMFLDGQGSLLYSSNKEDMELKGTVLALPGLAQAQAGRESALTNYSLFSLSNVFIDVYQPVMNASRQVIGIVRLTYRLGSLYEIFNQLRWQILLALVVGLVLSGALGAWLAISISRPVGEVTAAINSLASGERREPVEENGPLELRTQARAVNSLVGQLHSLETSRRQLLANIVHELGRPLGALRSAIHALGNGAAEDPVLLAELTHGMDDETRRLQALLEELANLYDKTTGELELHREPVETSTWLRDALSPWRAAALDKRLQWQEEISEGLRSISIDGMRMQQVLGNLLSNAIKYTPAGGTIRVSAGEDEKAFWFTVCDTGAGIRTDELEKVFLPYYRGDTGKRIKQGMGLGLTIALELVKAHGGDLSVKSEAGQGSEFTLRLPTHVGFVPPKK
ncbi:MAG TPA: sensor histidine kinase [Anaerolineales bacterium]|jgi:signal transduction histidine kinase